MVNLTKAQRGILLELSVARKFSTSPHAWHNHPTYRSLLKRGMIERCDHIAQLGPSITFTTFLCRLTDAGRAALRESQK